MRAAPTPTQPPPPPPVRTDTRAVEPDEQWKAELHKRIEDGLRGMVEEAQTVRDTILNSQPSESSRSLALSNYEKSTYDIRTLAQDEFTRQLRIEMSERKRALDVADSDPPDVARQQQRVLDSIRKTDEDPTTSAPSDAPHSPPQQGDSEHGSDESPEDGYGSAGQGDEAGESGESRETSEEGDEDEEEGEDWGEENAAPRQLRPPSRPNVPLTQPLHSKSSVSRRNAHSHQLSNFHPTEDSDDEEAYDSRGHTVQRHPYSLGGPPRGQISGSQSSLWRPVPRAPEPSSISRTTTFSHAHGQKYNTGPVQFPRRGGVNSFGSTSSGAGLHRAGSQNSGQYRTSSIAPQNGAESPPMQNRDRIASNIAHRERQTSASASPHKRPSPSSYPTVSRAIPGARPPPLDDAVRFPTSASPGPRTLYGLQRPSEDMRPGIAIPRGPTIPEDGPQGTSWSSPNSRRSSGDFDLHRRHNSKGDRLPPVDGDLSDASDDVVGQLDVRRSMHSFCDVRSVRSLQSVDLEQRALWIEAEAERMEEKANKREDEARRLEEKARQSLEEAKRLEAGARQAEASAKMREAAAKNKEIEAKRKEAEVKKREVESQRREAEAQRKEEQVRQMEREARRKEEQARRKEEEAQRKEDEARKREEEVRRKEDDARKREDDTRRREEDARQKGEDVRRFEEEMERKEAELKEREAELLRREQAARLQTDGPTVEAQEGAKADASVYTREDSARQTEAESIAPESEARTKAQGRKGSESQAKRQKEKDRELEERRQKEQEEQQQLEKQWQLEEQLRAAEEERYMLLEEQRRKPAEQSRPRQQQDHHQEGILRQRAQEEQQKEFERRAVQYYQRAEERARQHQEPLKREQEWLECEQQAKSARELELVRLYKHHENKWRQIRDCDNLGWNSFAWPVFKHPSEPEEMTTVAIRTYVLSKYAPDASTKISKDRIKDHLKRWHPDKFETRILPRVVEEEREKVKIGASVVVRGLNVLLNRNTSTYT